MEKLGSEMNFWKPETKEHYEIDSDIPFYSR